MRPAVRAVRLLIADLAALFAPAQTRAWFLILSMLVLQAGFWYLATPGPTLLRFAVRDPITAAAAVAWSLVFLLLLPALIYRLSVGRLDEAHLRWGDARFGLAAVLGLALITVPIIVLASGDRSLALTYPWPGAWPGESPLNLLAWAGMYFMYYLAFEAFYRGFVLSAAARAWGEAKGLWFQAILATMVHLGKPLPELLAAAPASLLFGVLALRTRSILYPALLHLVIGLTLDVTLLARSGQLAW